MKARILTVLLLLTLVVAIALLPAQAETQDPATTGMNAPLDFAASTTQVCPKCGTSQTWQPLTAITADTTLEAGHYYVPEGGLTNTAQYNTSTTQKASICIHLNGQTLTSSKRVFKLLGYNNTLNVFGSGTVRSNDTKYFEGAVYMLGGSGTVNIYGGTHETPKATETYPIKSTDSAGAKLYIYDGATISTGKWRTIRMTTGTITMNGGTINGGNVYSKNGGTILMEGGTFNMKGGTIQNAVAITGNGGNLYMSGGTFDMTGGTIQGGSAASGGNVYVAGGTFKMTGGTIQNGTASANGGNIATASKTLTIGGNVLNGTAATGGGNISGSTGSVLTVSGTVAGGTVTGTAGGNWGGNIYAWQATVNVEEGAKIYGGTGGSKSGAANIGVLGDTAGKTAILNLNGGTVVGDIHTSAPAGEFTGTTVTITGAPNVVKSLEVDGVTYSATTQGLFLDGVTADISGMTGGTIYLSGNNDQAMTVADANADLMEGCFFAYNSTSQQVALTDSVFYLVERQDEPSEFAPWDNGGKAYCPVCKAVKTWTATSGSGSLGTLQDGAHIYLATNHDATGMNQALYVDTSAKACFNLNGKTLSLDGRIGINTTDATLNIMDTSADGTGVVTSTGTRTGSPLYNYTVNVQKEGSTINLYGGTYKNSNSSYAVVRCSVKTAAVNILEGAVIDGNNTCRGILLSDGTLNVNGGTIKNGVSAADGGNIYMETGNLNIKGGKIMGGSAVNGGNVYVKAGTFKITDDGDENTDAPQLVGGTATTGKGGNIYTAGNLDLSNCTISNGSATASDGGNIAIIGTSTNKLTANFGEGAKITGGKAYNGGSLAISYTTVNFTAAELSGGTATNRGGNVEVGGQGILKMSGGLIDGGTTKGNGGNLYLGSVTAQIKMTGGTISNGTSNKSGTYNGGGNIYANSGNVYIYGGVISGGQAPNGYGGNIASRAGINNAKYNVNNRLVINGDGDPTTPKPVITGGTSKNTGGNIYINGDHYKFVFGYFELGDCVIEKGECVAQVYGDDISIQHSGVLTVKKSFACETPVDIFISSCCLPVEAVGGRVDPECGFAEGYFPGILQLDQKATKPLLVGRDGETGLYVSESALVHKDGTYTFFVDNASMMAAYDDTVEYIRACPGDLPLSGGNYVVDLLGNTVNFTGTGSVTCFDSKNDDYTVYGTATFEDGVTLTNTASTTFGEKNYATVVNNDTYSFHRYDVKLTNVSLRPSAAGIYYTGQWSCDDVLKEYIGDFGVAVSVQDEPADNFRKDGHSRYTKFANSEFKSGEKKTGVLVTGILKDTSAERIEQNATYAQTQIYATAYMSIDGQTYISASKNFSMKDVLDKLNVYRETFAQTAINTMRSFMTTWASKGLSGEPWSDYRFDVSEDVYHLESLYADRVAYHGEFHDHANTGGKSDGKVTLKRIKEVMAVRGMDFTTLLDHKQILHMELEEWDETMFIGGSETATILDGAKEDTGNDMHINMIFSNADAFVNFMETQTRLDWKLDETSGEWHYEDTRFTTAQLKAHIQTIKDCGGMYVFPHPKDGTRFIHDDPLDYWFADEVGLEVLTVKANDDRTRNAYTLWTDLLKAGKRIWATAGSDSHSLPNTNALTTIYSDRKHADAYLGYAKVGDTTCGPVGIRMCVGDTRMGGQTSFDGKRLVFCIDDIHESVDMTKEYTVKLIQCKNGVESVAADCGLLDASKPFYYYMEADNTVSYYRVEIYDVAIDSILALGNPIWNVQEG